MGDLDTDKPKANNMEEERLDEMRAFETDVNELVVLRANK